eukprot:TRINITY_DN1536_c0_g1_i2.p1 TRINITY_DN1536_c0_g1~~TRINITY_DN1536_c0_g1_i2.p1  ORF type:complete len:436 (-),score=68.50 TRINITY_DN1536_c0_g1_i2:99-1406(-)
MLRKLLQAREKSNASTIEGVVKEVLGTALSIHCSVHNQSPKQIQSMISSKEIVIDNNDGTILLNPFSESSKLSSSIEGFEMRKLKTSHSVINIMVPREFWPRIQSIRTLYVSNARAGPHISFLDPFIDPSFYPRAAQLLVDKLESASFSPFQVTLSHFGIFSHSESSHTLYLSPTTSPNQNSILDLLRLCLEVFPQCNDLIKKSEAAGGSSGSSSSSSSGGSDITFNPHITIAQMSDLKKLTKLKEKLEKQWEPISFCVKELYFLSREAGYPFRVSQVIPFAKPFGCTTTTTLDKLSSSSYIPHFGPNSYPYGSEADRTFVLCLPSQDTKKSRKSNTRHYYSSCFLSSDILSVPFKYEYLSNPGGSSRYIYIVVVNNQKDADKLKDLGTLDVVPGSQVIHLPSCTFPDKFQGCCSLKEVNDNPPSHWGFNFNSYY